MQDHCELDPIIMTKPEDMTPEDMREDEALAAALDQEGEDVLTPEGQILKLEEELNETKDRMLRLAAELENTRRRAEREKQEATKFGISAFARDMLAVADNFQRALAAAPEEQDEALQSFINGIRLTEKEMMAALQRNKVERVDPAGDRFDPNLHQAIAEVPGTGEPAGIIVDVVQPGFVIGERVLRPAMVTVSNGAGAKAKEADGGDAVDLEQDG